MKKILSLITLSTMSVFGDPGIMIDIEIIIHGPSGVGGNQVEIACK